MDASASCSSGSDPLGGLVVKDGFRLRGLAMTRMETFTDAAFAFAVTLLVISIDAVPTNYAELVKAIQGIPAFALSFLLLMLFWRAHWEWSRRFGLDDTPSMILSGGLVFTVLCYVYPLKYLMSLMIHWISGGQWGLGVTLDSAEQLYRIFTIYGMGFVAMSLVIVLLNLYAYSLRAELRLNALEQFDTKAEIAAWFIATVVGLLSVLAALFSRPGPFALPGWIYFLMPISMPIFGIFTGRRRKALLQ